MSSPIKRVSSEFVQALDLAKKKHKEKYGFVISDVEASKLISKQFVNNQFLKKDRDEDNIGIF